VNERTARRKFGVLATGFAIAAVSSCGVATDSSPRRLDASLDTAIKVAVGTTVPVDVDQGSATTTPFIVPEQRPVVVYLAQGEGLVPRARSLPEPLTPDDVVGLLKRGPTENEVSAGMRTMFTSEGQIVTVSDIVDGIVTVGLDPSVLELTGSDQLLLIGQLTLTLTSLTAVSSVLYVVGDAPISVVGPDGSSIDRLVIKADFSALVFR